MGTDTPVAGPGVDTPPARFGLTTPVIARRDKDESKAKRFRTAASELAGTKRNVSPGKSPFASPERKRRDHEDGGDGMDYAIQDDMEYFEECVASLLDDPSGEYIPMVEPEELDFGAILEARCKEIERMIEWDVFECVRLDELPARSKILTLTWVDKKKEEEECGVRSRICARDFNTYKRLDTFAATPSASSRFMVEWYATHRGYPTRLADVSAAFLHAEMKELVYVRPPAEFVHPEWEFGTYVWKLKKALYGMRSAPRAWQEHLSQLLEDAGFKRGVAAPTLFYSAKYDTLVDVHVDDIHATGSETGLTYLFAYLKEHLCIKVSPIHGQDSEYTFLRAKRTRKDGRLTVTPCEDYARGAAKLLDLTHCRPATPPLP